MSEFIITYYLTIEADDEDKAIDDGNTILFTGEEHSDAVHLVDWSRNVDIEKVRGTRRFHSGGAADCDCEVCIANKEES